MESQQNSSAQPVQNTGTQTQVQYQVQSTQLDAQATAITAVFSSEVTILTGLGYGGNKALIQWGSDNRIRLYEAIGGQWSLVFNVAPNEIKKYSQVYGALTIKLANTSLPRSAFQLMFDAGAYKRGMMSQTVSGGLVFDLLRAKMSSDGINAENDSGITWWVETLKRFGVAGSFGNGRLTNRFNYKWSVGVSAATAVIMIILGIVVFVAWAADL